MQSHAEQKTTIIPYDEIEQQITSSEKFKEIYVENRFPDEIVSLKLCLRQLKSVLCLHDIIDRVEQSEFFLIDFYNKLLTKENMTAILGSLNVQLYADETNLVQYYLLSKMLKKLIEQIEMINKPLQNDYDKKVLRAVSYHQFLEQSSIIKYLNEVLDRFFKKESQSWSKYKKIKNNLLNEKRLSLIEKDNILESLIPNKGELNALCLKYLKIDTHDFKSLVDFININYVNFPKYLKEEISYDVIGNKLRSFINKQQLLNKINISDDSPGISDNKRAILKYHHIIDDVHQLNTCIEEEFKPNHFDHALVKSWNFILIAFERIPDLRNMYLLAHIQESVRHYSPGLLTLNKFIIGLLSENKVSHEGRTRLVNKIIAIFLQVTDPNFAIVERSICWAYMHDEFDFSILLRNKYLETFQPNVIKNLFHDDYSRQQLLKKLSIKEAEYLGDFYEAIIKQDEKLAHILILRLVAVDYTKEKICSEKLISSQQLQQEINTLFTKEALHTRAFFKSDLLTIVEEVDSLQNEKPSHRFGMFHSVNVKAQSAGGNEVVSTKNTRQQSKKACN